MKLIKIYRDETGEVNVDINLTKTQFILIAGCTLGIILLILANI